MELDEKNNGVRYSLKDLLINITDRIVVQTHSLKCRAKIGLWSVVVGFISVDCIKEAITKV